MTAVTFTCTAHAVRTSLYQALVIAATVTAACRGTYTIVTNSAVAVLIAIGVGMARCITRVIRCVTAHPFVTVPAVQVSAIDITGTVLTAT